MADVGIFDPRALTLPPDLRGQYQYIGAAEGDLAKVLGGAASHGKSPSTTRRRVVLTTGPVVPSRVVTVLQRLEALKASFLEDLKAFEQETRDNPHRQVGAFPTIGDQSMSPPFFVTRGGRVPMRASDFADVYPGIADDPAVSVTCAIRMAWRVGQYSVADIEAEYQARIARKAAAIDTARQRHQHERVDQRTRDLGSLHSELRAIRDLVAELEGRGLGPVVLRIASGEGADFHAAFPERGAMPREALPFGVPNVAAICVAPGTVITAARKRQRASATRLVGEIGRVGVFVARP